MDINIRNKFEYEIYNRAYCNIGADIEDCYEIKGELGYDDELITRIDEMENTLSIIIKMMDAYKGI